MYRMNGLPGDLRGHDISCTCVVASKWHVIIPLDRHGYTATQPLDLVEGRFEFRWIKKSDTLPSHKFSMAGACLHPM